MNNIVFLLSHIPNPRMLKRIKVLENKFSISVIYWDRCLSNKEDFEINKKHRIEKISVPAPMGKPLKRIIPWIKFLLKSIYLLKDTSPSILHVNNVDMLFIAVIYKKFFKDTVKIVYEIADLPKYCFVKKIRSIKNIFQILFQKFEGGLMKSISKIILTSPYFWDEYYSKHLNKDKYLFIPNVPYKSLFGNYSKVLNKKFTVGFIGSVRFSSQIKLLIDAVEQMDEDIQILIAGNGPEYEDVKEYASNKAFVEMFGPYNYEKEIVGLYEKIDCVYSIYDTKKENIKIALPNRLYESIVCGLPIIAAKDTALGKFIEEKEIGFAVGNSRSDLIERLSDLFWDSTLREKINERCNTIKDNYYFENIANQLLNEYIKLL